MIRFKSGGDEVVDLIRSKSSELFRQIFKHVHKVMLEGRSIVVPTAEAALAMKFASMISPTRAAADRSIDAGDFGRAVVHQKTLDVSLLQELGELVYKGGGKDLVRLVDDAKAGRTLTV